MKYFASGWGTMIAEVLCSGSSWNSSVSCTSMLVEAEQVVELGLVLEVGAGRVAPRVARAAVLLAEETGDRGAVLVGEAPLLTDAVVPQLGERFGHLHREPVAEQVLLVAVLGEQLALVLGGGVADGDHVERGVVGVAALDRPEEVGDAEMRVFSLAREA